MSYILGIIFLACAVTCDNPMVGCVFAYEFEQGIK